ncbi:alpha/beta hydrolase [Thermodesulfobacteriota bacterium]
MTANEMKNLTCREISFLSDGFLLKGFLHLPDADRPPVVIGSHGLLSTGSSPKQIKLAEKCNRLGIGFLRFDHRGCGSSEGVFKEVNSFDARCSDLLNAVEMIQARNDTGNRIGLFGSSMGGAVCISTASLIDIDGLVTFAALLRSAPIMEAHRNSKDSETLGDGFFERNFLFDISDGLSKIHNILIFHGKSDEVVPVSHAVELYEKTGHPKKLILQEGGDHRMSDTGHQKRFILESASWLKRCFDDRGKI